MADQKKSNRALWGAAGGLKAHSLNSANVMLAGARRGFRERFERQVRDAADEAGEDLTPDELARRSDRLRRSHMLMLAARSAEVRRSRHSEGRDDDRRSALTKQGSRREEQSS